MAKELDIKHTSYYPGYLPGFGRGVFCKSFLTEDKVEELWEMKELVIRHSKSKNIEHLLGRDQEVLKEHNIEQIYLILDQEFKSKKLISDFFEMIGFDALIGHGDRHWGNYGVVVSGRPVTARFAPIYDTASGYLTEHNIERCEKMLQGDLINSSWYRPKMKGLCKITVPENIKGDHFDLLEYVLEDSEMTVYKSSLSKAFRNFDPEIVRAILNKFFPKLNPIRRKVIEIILKTRWKIGLEVINKHKDDR